MFRGSEAKQRRADGPSEERRYVRGRVCERFQKFCATHFRSRRVGKCSPRAGKLAGSSSCGKEVLVVCRGISTYARLCEAAEREPRTGARSRATSAGAFDGAFANRS